MSNSKTGILLVNLGSPDSHEVKDVRRYLGEFLMDENVIDVPWLIRNLIVKGFILPFRPKESAHAYSTIWWDKGSPLIVLSQRVYEKLKKKVDAPIALGMRYGNPSIESAIKELMKQSPDLEEIFLIPLYPQYAMATTKTVIDKTQEVINANKWNLRLKTQEPFYKEPTYIDALAKSMEPFAKGEYDHILFSFHGVPERHVRKTDPTKAHCTKVDNCCMVHNAEAHKYCYAHQCKVTAQLIADQLGLKDGKWSWSFQSRLGSDAWLKPYTDKELVRLAEQGVKNIAVACPAFVSDCLETLEEIGIRGKEDFVEAGGDDLTLIPCLNDDDNWIDVLAGYCEKQLLTAGSKQSV